MKKRCVVFTGARFCTGMISPRLRLYKPLPCCFVTADLVGNGWVFLSMSLEHRPKSSRLVRRRRRSSCRHHRRHRRDPMSIPDQPVLHSGETAHVQRRPNSRYRSWLKRVRDATSQGCTLARLGCFGRMCGCRKPGAMASGFRQLLALVAELSCLMWRPPSSLLTFLITLSSLG